MNWDHSVDVVVVGSGNGALTNALCNFEMGTKDVLLVEKTAVRQHQRHRRGRRVDTMQPLRIGSWC